MDPTTLLTSFSNIILGPAGVGFILAACVITWLLTPHFISGRHAFMAIGSGFGVWVVAWIIKQVLGSGGTV